MDIRCSLVAHTLIFFLKAEIQLWPFEQYNHPGVFQTITLPLFRFFEI